MASICAPRAHFPNGQAIQRLYEEKYFFIYHYIYHKIGNREEAEDLVADIFLKAAHGLDQGRSQESTHHWLYLIMRATLSDYWRAYYRASISSLDELLATGWEFPVEEAPTVPSKRSEDRIRQILQALPERYREVLRYRFLLQLSIQDTALSMGVSVANVRVLQSRALKRAADLTRSVSEASARRPSSEPATCQKHK